MNKLLMTASLALLLGLSGLAQARDLGPDEAVKLRDSGAVMDYQKLNEQALRDFAGGKIDETALKERYGRYIYQVDVLDAQGVEWELEFDAKTGEALNKKRED